MEQELQDGLDVKTQKEALEKLIQESLRTKRELLSGGKYRSDEKIEQLTRNLEELKKFLD